MLFAYNKAIPYLKKNTVVITQISAVYTAKKTTFSSSHHTVVIVIVVVAYVNCFNKLIDIFLFFRSEQKEVMKKMMKKK